MKRPFRVYANIEKMLVIEVDAYNQDEAESLALSGYGETIRDITITKEVNDIIEVEHDRIAED